MIESPDHLAQLRDLVDSGGSILGAFDRSIVPRSRALELIDLLIESLPDEMDQAGKIVAEREDILDKARKQAGEIIDDAVRRAEKLVDTDAITIEARKRSKDLMAETDEYIGVRLRDLEDELGRLAREVRAGIKVVGSPKMAGNRDEAGFNLDNM
jgi:hypothetical protein